MSSKPEFLTCPPPLVTYSLLWCCVARPSAVERVPGEPALRLLHKAIQESQCKYFRAKSCALSILLPPPFSPQYPIPDAESALLPPPSMMAADLEFRRTSNVRAYKEPSSGILTNPLSAPFRAFYECEDAASQVDAFVCNSIRSQVPLLTFEQLFSKESVLEEVIRRDINIAIKVRTFSLDSPMQRVWGRRMMLGIVSVVGAIDFTLNVD